MVDDVDWGRSRMDLTDWWRRVLLHDRQWVVVARSSRGARIARICRVARI